ncbi:hypothetical protein SLS62_001429 [Diatrype stigma]|uniref:Uncharacterized protein n=1 Tax=Diatrype stigma TaxID=117547 RepID=A0AAN9V144_9PEZI
MLSPRMALNHWVTTSWRLFLVILLTMCWFTGLLLWQSNDDDRRISSLSPAGDNPSSTAKVGSSSSPKNLSLLSPQPPQTSLTPPFHWKGYSIKPVAYVFPQFHAIPENDRFWGVNFTEWDNVRMVVANRFGLETLRPAPEVGYYNILNYETRARQARLDKPLQAMLDDGQPDVPFMLSWANEPWTVRWDGHDDARGDGILMKQEYGSLADWKNHFDWMATYFRHPNYIRNGATGKAQVVIYSPIHAGDKGKRMFEAWKTWAAQDPAIGGLDVIETHIHGDRHDRGQTGAISEFGGRSGGIIDDTTSWRFTPRRSPVFHRGARVTWDNTPRHATDNRATSQLWSHPELWKTSHPNQSPWDRTVNIIEQLRRIKLDPNPVGEENFFFINSLNEWGEGNVFEESVQWGDMYPKAFKEAMEYADAHLPWIEDLVLQGETLALRDSEPDAESEEVDVCVIIREFHAVWPWTEAFDLSYTLRSLQAQNNERWRAVVVPIDDAKDAKRKIHVAVLDSWDPRVAMAEVPDEFYTGINESSDGLEVTDWVIENMASSSPSCAGAKYMLITNSTNFYEPNTFDAATTNSSSGDIIGLNFVSESTMESAAADNLTWDQRCDRLEDSTYWYCQAMRPELQEQELDLEAVLIDFQRWQREGNKLAPDATHQQEQELELELVLEREREREQEQEQEEQDQVQDQEQQEQERRHEQEEEPSRGAAVLQHLARRTVEPWAWTSLDDTPYHLVHANTYPACAKAGWIWVDIPEKGDFKPGCHRGKDLANKYGRFKISTRWDYGRFKRDPFCVRMSEATYEEVLSQT